MKTLASVVLFLAALGAGGSASGAWSPSTGDWGKTSASDIRVMTFNVRDAIRSGNNMNITTNNWHACARIVALLKPDVLILEEAGDTGCSGCVDSVATLTATAQEFIQGGPGVSVYVQQYAPGFDMPYIFVPTETDNFNRNVILSRHPFADLNGDTRSTYSDIPSVSGLAAWAPGGDGGIRGFQFVEIDLPNGTYAGNLVVGGAHLKAGGGSSDQFQRLTAAQNVSWFVDQFYNGANAGTPDPTNTISDSPAATTILGPNTPVVLGGDWNEDEGTNGRRGPEAWLSEGEFAEPTLDGIDRDRTDCGSTFGVATDLTGDPDTLGSSTVDYLTWQDSIATLRRAVIFNSTNIGTLGYATPPEFAGVFSVSTLSSTASDHLPVFVDLILPLGTPEGACCDGTDCTIMTEADCMTAGGVYQGDDTTCTPNPCEPMGACCTFGACTIETSLDCFNMGGTYQGDGTDCDPNPCPPAGACCNGSGTCLIRTQAECDSLGGTYQGDGTTCTPNPCPQPGGCCIAGVCSELLETDCNSMGGAFLGEGTTCAGDPCPNIGACCFICDPAPTAPCPDASGVTGAICVNTTVAACAAANGIYRGDGTACAMAICNCVGDLNADGATDVFDFGSFSSNFGSGNPGCVGHAQGDLNCDGVVDVFDFGLFASDFGCQ